MKKIIALLVMISVVGFIGFSQETSNEEFGEFGQMVTDNIQLFKSLTGHDWNYFTVEEVDGFLIGWGMACLSLFNYITDEDNFSSISPQQREAIGLEVLYRFLMAGDMIDELDSYYLNFALRHSILKAVTSILEEYR